MTDELKFWPSEEDFNAILAELCEPIGGMARDNEALRAEFFAAINTATNSPKFRESLRKFYAPAKVDLPARSVLQTGSVGMDGHFCAGLWGSQMKAAVLIDADCITVAPSDPPQ